MQVKVEQELEIRRVTELMLASHWQQKELWDTEEKVENWVEWEVVAVKLLLPSRTPHYRSLRVNQWPASVECAAYLRRAPCKYGPPFVFLC